MLANLELADNETTHLLRERVAGLHLRLLIDIPQLVFPEPVQVGECNYVEDKVVVICAVIKVHEGCFIASDTSAQIVCYLPEPFPVKSGWFYLISHFRLFCARNGVFALTLESDGIIDLESPVHSCILCQRPRISGIKKCNFHLNEEFSSLNERTDYKQVIFTDNFAFKNLSDGLASEYADFLNRIRQQNTVQQCIPASKQERAPYPGKKIIVFHCLDCNRVYFSKWARCEELEHRLETRMIWRFEAVCGQCGYRIVTVRRDERCIICGEPLLNQVEGLPVSE